MKRERVGGGERKKASRAVASDPGVPGFVSYYQQTLFTLYSIFAQNLKKDENKL